MHKLLTLTLFALLLILPHSAMAEDASLLGVDALSPIACDAAADGGVIDLYCGPTQGFYRREGQTLDLARPYVFFGQFDCWAMVAQGTAEAFGPVGWVESALLETLPNVPELSFECALAAMVEEDAPLTNDPLAAGEDAAWSLSLSRGAEVTILAHYGDWLYVQTEIDRIPARVFLPAGAIL